MMKIRPFHPTDSEYQAILQLRNRIQPANPSSLAIWKHNDQTRDPHDNFHRIVVEKEGELIAYGEFGETAVKNGAYFLYAHVHPVYQGGHLTARLYNHMAESLQTYQPARLITHIRENETMKLHWLRQNRFEQGKRYPVSHLDVASFNPAPYAAAVAQVAASGIEIISLADLTRRDPGWQRQVYELDFVLMSDVPTTEPYVKRPFPRFVKEEFQHPNFLPEGWFIALDGAAYVGMTGLVKTGGHTNICATALTGVLRSHRRQGIATALKTTSIQLAQQIGTQTIKTDNEENNPMYQLNLDLGFIPQPAWLDFVKNLAH